MLKTRRRNRLFGSDFPKMPFTKQQVTTTPEEGFGAPLGSTTISRKQDKEVTSPDRRGIREIGYGKKFGIRRRVR